MYNRFIKKCLAVLVAVVFLLGASSAGEEAKTLGKIDNIKANPSVIGKWGNAFIGSDIEPNIVAVSDLVIEFIKGGEYIVMEDKTEVEKGTYKVEGNTLTFMTRKMYQEKMTQIEEKMTFAVKGDVLTLTLPEKPIMVILKRIP